MWDSESDNCSNDILICVYPPQESCDGHWALITLRTSLLSAESSLSTLHVWCWSIDKRTDDNVAVFDGECRTGFTTHCLVQGLTCLWWHRWDSSPKWQGDEACTFIENDHPESSACVEQKSWWYMRSTALYLYVNVTGLFIVWLILSVSYLHSHCCSLKCTLSFLHLFIFVSVYKPMLS